MKPAFAAAAALIALAGCASAPRVATDEDHRACKEQSYNDPTVKAMIMKGAGTDRYYIDNQYAFKYAEQDAITACLRGRGLVAPGGVERQKSLW